MGRTITISGRVYRKNPEVDRYQIHLDDLGDLRMQDIPPNSHLEILGLPEPRDAEVVEVYGLNNGSELSVYGGVSFKVPTGEASRIVARLRRAFPSMVPNGQRGFEIPSIRTYLVEDGIIVDVFLNLIFDDRPETLVRDAFLPFIDGFRRLEKPSVYVFICHASEDKPAARDLASAMKALGADVWFDEWEIRVGDSIVQKIDHALGKVSHLVVLLSRISVERPWVQKELSSALMLQLSEKGIRVLPLRLDDCTVPPILADIKYADARMGMTRAVVELEATLFAGSEPDESA